MRYKIPSPAECGLPEQFSNWRPKQEEALEWLRFRSQKRIKGLCAPTGFGKTSVYVADALLSGEATCFVTDNRALQDQLMREFGSIGMVDLRGRKNYECGLREDYTCEQGFVARCPHKGTVMCPASQAAIRANLSLLVTTNYAKWTAAKKYGQGMDHFKKVVFDEGHGAPDAVDSAMQVMVHHREREQHILLDPPSDPTSLLAWKVWAGEARVIIDEQAKIAQDVIKGQSQPRPSAVRHALHMRQLLRRLNILATARPAEWVVEELERGFQFDPIRSGRYAESVLFLRVPSVLVISATLRPKTLHMLGQGSDTFDFQEFDSDFDPARCPVYWVPTMRVDSRSTDWSPLWLKLDQIAARRQDRKGIIHTVSFARRDQILSLSRFAGKMLINEKGSPSGEMVEHFKQSPAGTIFVSPSVGQGFDFPGCLSPNTRILTADLNYVPVGTLQPGDKLLAFDEDIPTGRRTRSWREAVVINNSPGVKPCRRVTLSDGTQFVCSLEHPWLVSTGKRAAYWQSTDKLKPFGSSLLRLVESWEPGDSWDAGYLSGIWDGEGHISQRLNQWRSGGEMPHVVTGMSQVDNIVLAQTMVLLNRHGISYKTYVTKRRKSTEQDKTSVLVINRRDILHLLGWCRPLRILSKLRLDLLGSLRPMTPVQIVSIEDIGLHPVSLLSTSTRTYVAEGFASHNSQCEWQFLTKIPFPPPSKILKARTDADKDYPHYLAMQSMVQAFGRGMRYAADQCENFICDDHVEWFLPKHGHLAPRSFRSFFRRVERLPQPPPPL